MHAGVVVARRFAGTGAAQWHLLPALMRVYAVADAVVGLDVDRDSFDKFRCSLWQSLWELGVPLD